MRVLHVSPRYYPVIGGSERYCQEISERLVRDGHQVTVFTTNAQDHEYFWDPSKAHLEVGAVHHNGAHIRRFAVRHLPASRWAFGGLRHTMRLLAFLPADTSRLLFRLCQWVPWVPGLCHQMAQEPAGAYDLAHVTVIPLDSIVYATYRFAKQRGIPLVITPFVHLGEPHDKAVRQYYTMPHQMTMLRESAAVIVQTELERELLLSHGVPAEQMHKVGVGITPQELLGGRAARLREKYGLERPLVFYVGAQAYDKGTVHLVQAMMRLWEQGSEADLVLAGPAMSEFEDYFGSLPRWARERCHLLGYISEEDKRDLLDAGSVFAMPSRTDSFGIVYLEAWLYKKPVVGALAGGVPEVIRDNEDGLLVPFGDVARLAQAIHTLLSDRTKAQQLGERGHRKALAHTWDRKYTAIKAIYEDVIPRDARSRS